MAHCIDFNIISERQAAYLKGDSTISQLIYIVHMIRSSWAQNKITQGIFLDISAAFDTVWHKGLLSKLMQIRIEDKVLDLFSSYLTNRKQVVVVDGVKSSVKDVKAGVPQGSRLGPLLFIIYINDISKDLESEILIFADDTTLLASGTDPTETTEILNRDLNKISNWAKKWKINFNPKKSKDMIFSKKYICNSLPVMFNNTLIERVSSHKHLGIYITNTLDWSLQVDQVCLKANKKLSILRSVKCLQRKTLDMLYKVTVRSVIDYGLPIYFNNLRQTEIAKINKVQYRAAKIVTGALNLTSQVKLEQELGWETIQNRATYLGVTFFHKIHLKETRPLIRRFMPPSIDFSEYELRNKYPYVNFPFHTMSFSNSFFPYYTKYWNKLPPSIRCKNLFDFKNELSLLLKPKKYKL